jgi:hypothetical protein
MPPTRSDHGDAACSAPSKSRARQGFEFAAARCTRARRRPPAAQEARDLLLRYLDRVAAAGRLRVPPARAAQLAMAAVTDVTFSLIGIPADDRDPEISPRMRDILVDSLVTDPAPTADPGLASRALALDAALIAADEDSLPLRPPETALLRDWLDQLAR